MTACDIYIQIQILWTSWQYYIDQKECIFTSPRVKLTDKVHGSALHW
jgi:hypothetical protein